MLAALLAITGGLLDLVGRPSVPETKPEAGPRAEAALEDPRPSIAVLPFADMSPEGDQEYFADGVAEEILNAIARIPSLRVAARTSAFSFKGENIDVRQVGERLSVGAVLEGSVRQEGDRLRITAQLIDARDGFHLWSERYDRELKSIFEVQDEIAREIVRALEVQLVGSQALSIDIPTTSPEAYEAYLRARHAIGTGTLDTWRHARDLLERALELDPEFAPAYASLALTHLLQGWFGVAPYEETAPLARGSALRALELDDRVSDAHAVLGYFALYHDWDWGGAERRFLRALELNPNDFVARHGYGDLLSILGDGEEGLRQVELGRSADPLSAIAVFPVLGHKVFLRRFDEVIHEIDSLRALFPENPEVGRDFLGAAYWHSGRRLEALDRWRPHWAADPALVEAVEAGLAEGGPESAMRAWANYRARQAEDRGADPYGVAVLYGRAGETTRAFEWLDRAFESRSWSLLHVTMEPAFDALRDDPRYRQLLQRIGIPE
jgi:TolB-like protein